MSPNSGIYKIKIKINEIHGKSTRCKLNIIGITSNTDKTNNSIANNEQWFFSHEYIGWSSWDSTEKIHKNVPNGLVCGKSDTIQPDNIFVLSKFKYVSNNEWYKNALPGLQSGDTIIMRYDSYKSELSFSKSNDKLLDSKITNLPKNKTFYWMVGHICKPMSITIVQ